MKRRAFLNAVFLPFIRLAYSQRQILPDYQADPSGRVFHGRLYVYPSHDIAGSKGWDMVDWHVFSSRDLTHWKDHGVIFSLNDITWAKQHAWAPDCIERRGKFYFYFPADNQIGVAVGDSQPAPSRTLLANHSSVAMRYPA